MADARRGLLLTRVGNTGELLGSGVVSRLHDEVYARLPRGRLVVLGGPGAGKTGTMILLVLAALDHRASLAADQRERVPVPVWLTLGGWDPVMTSLRAWAAAGMRRDHPALGAPDFRPDAPMALVGSGRVALFLDGLDEMPEGQRRTGTRTLGPGRGRLRQRASRCRGGRAGRP